MQYSGLVEVEGSSMEPTYYEGNRLTYVRTAKFKGYNHGDVVVIDLDGKNTILKRIIGIPGDNVRLVNGKVYVNEEEVSYPSEGQTFEGDNGKEFTLDEKDYFVLGDNRELSLDSRYSNIGLINLEQIIGKVR